MNRLTRVESSSVLIKDGWKKKDTESYTSICYGCEEIGKCVNKCGFYKALEKLTEYEDTGLEPEEVKQLNASDASKEESSIKYYNEMRKYRDELKYYKKLEEQGLLVKLPCKVGELVYSVNSINSSIYEYEIKNFMITDTGEYAYAEGVKGGHQFKLFDFGKTVFTTQEEAEKALEATNGERT